MSRGDFFNGVTRRIDQWMGELFVHKNVAPAELKSMDYAELKYWYSWWEPEREELKRQAQKQKELAKR
jgi:hypothetical protein